MTITATTTFHPDGSVTLRTDEGTERFLRPVDAEAGIVAALARVQRLAGDALTLQRLHTLTMIAEID